MTADWTLQETAQAELEATIEAAAYALLRWAANTWVVIASSSSPEEATQAAIASPVLRTDVTRVDRLRQKLRQARLNFTEAVLPVSLSILRADGASDEMIANAEKIIRVLIGGYATAVRHLIEDEQRVTALAETMIALRAEVGDYSFEDEQADYGFAQAFVYGLRKRNAPAPGIDTAELEEALRSIQ